MGFSKHQLYTKHRLIISWLSFFQPLLPVVGFSSNDHNDIDYEDSKNKETTTTTKQQQQHKQWRLKSPPSTWSDFMPLNNNLKAPG